MLQDKRLCLMFWMSLSGMVLGQDASRRMLPEDWFNQAHVQDAWHMAAELCEADRVQVHMSGNSLVQPHGGGDVWLRDGDLRMVLDSTGKNLSVSHNIGFNCGAYHFSYRNRLMSIGGQGFWDKHAKLIEFLPEIGEWEWLPCSGGPNYVKASGCWLNHSQDAIVAVAEPELGAGDEKTSVVWSLDLQTLEWSAMGVLSDTFEVFHPGANSRTLETKDYVVWVRSHQSVVLRKADGYAVVSTGFSAEGMASLELTAADHWAMAVKDNVIHWHKSDSDAVDHQWDVELDFENALKTRDAMAFVVPGSSTDVMSANENRPMSATGLPWGWVLAALGGGVLGLGLGRQRRTPSPSTTAPKSGVVQAERGAKASPFPEAPIRAGAYSREVEALVAMGLTVMDSDELNLHLGLGSDVSSESKRARRAQFIREINREYQRHQGADLIFRERDPEDRRRTNYVIRPHSSPA